MNGLTSFAVPLDIIHISGNECAAINTCCGRLLRTIPWKSRLIVDEWVDGVWGRLAGTRFNVRRMILILISCTRFHQHI
jgi:hypothetical protein